METTLKFLSIPLAIAVTLLLVHIVFKKPETFSQFLKLGQPEAIAKPVPKPKP